MQQCSLLLNKQLLISLGLTATAAADSGIH